MVAILILDHTRFRAS